MLRQLGLLTPSRPGATAQNRLLRKACQFGTQIACLLTATWLAGCKQTLGQPYPPASYGTVQSSVSGCPEFKHAYAWPAFEGVTYKNDMNSAERKPKKMMGLAIYGPSALVIQARRGQPDMRLSAHPLRGGAPLSVKGPGWARAFNGSGTWGCDDGYAWVDEAITDGTMDNRYEGADHLRGAQRWFMAPLQDGSLALGRRITSSGGTTYLFTWGKLELLPFPTPTTEAWAWSHLQAIPMADLSLQ